MKILRYVLNVFFGCLLVYSLYIKLQFIIIVYLGILFAFSFLIKDISPNPLDLIVLDKESKSKDKLSNKDLKESLK